MIKQKRCIVAWNDSWSRCKYRKHDEGMLAASCWKNHWYEETNHYERSLESEGSTRHPGWCHSPYIESSVEHFEKELFDI